MDYYKFPTNIGTNDLQKLTTYIHNGVIHLLEKRMLWRSKWEQKYVVICKGLNCTWNMCCYASAFADKADINYSMLEFESVKEYDNISENVIGFTMKFEEPTRNPLIFRCDTKESRKIWMKHAKEAIQEAHKDSGYSSDTDRQSKKYATIGDVDEDIPKKTGDTETYPDELDNGLQTNASFQMETAIATAESCEQLEPNDDEYYDCEAKHSYENMIAENSSFKVYRRKPIHNEEGNTNKCERQRNVDETDVKEVYPHPVQETKIDTKAKQSSENTNKTRVKKRKSPRYRTADTGRQIPCSRYRTAESTKTANSEHIYENTAQMSLQMGKLQLDLSPEEDGSEDHSHTDVKEVYRGSIQAMVKSDISFERGSTSPSESGSQPESPVFLEPPLYTPSVIEDDNTNLKLPVAPLTTSAVTAEGIPASFVSVRSDTHTDASESFASVRAGTETVHSSERKVDAHSDLGSPPSVTDSHVCSSLTRVNTVANSNAMRTQSVSVRSANHTHVQGKQSLSMCEDASFASVREGNRCHSSSLSKPNPNAKETKTLSAAVDTVCRGDSPLTSATGAATTPTAIKTYDGHSSSQTTEESLTLLQDEEVIYENTNICYSTETKYCRQGSESSSIHSTNSSSSITSRGSDTSLRKYESPDESAHYENIKFQKDEYLCKEKKNVKRLLKKKAPGTFLVGYAEQCSDLCVMTPVGIKYFRIHQQLRTANLDISNDARLTNTSLVDIYTANEWHNFQKEKAHFSVSALAVASAVSLRRKTDENLPCFVNDVERAVTEFDLFQSLQTLNIQIVDLYYHSESCLQHMDKTSCIEPGEYSRDVDTTRDLKDLKDSQLFMFKFCFIEEAFYTRMREHYDRLNQLANKIERLNHSDKDRVSRKNLRLIKGDIYDIMCTLKSILRSNDEFDRTTVKSSDSPDISIEKHENGSIVKCIQQHLEYKAVLESRRIARYLKTMYKGCIRK